MNRATFIRNYGDTDGFGESRSLFNAFVQCLIPEEACAALDLTFQQPFPLRRSILRKILRDIEEALLPCHEDLIHHLLESVDTVHYRKKQSAGHAISYLYDGLPPSNQDYLIRFFLGSQLIGFRRRGYKKLKNQWDANYTSLVEEIWNRHSDANCAALIIEHFPVADLKDNFELLEAAVLDTWSQTKLYLRVTSEHSEFLDHVSRADEITHAYLLVKLGRNLSNREAAAVYQRNKFDDRLGLLLWCFGHMGLWSVLETVADEIERLPYERFGLEFPQAT